MGNFKTNAVLGAAATLLVFFIVLDASDKRQLWNSSADFQADIQTDSTSAKDFFNFIAQASLVVTAAVQSFYYYGGAPALGMNLIVANALGYYLPAVLKMAYSDPRPYWEYDEVSGISCGTGWGNPSGHALYTSSVWLSLAVSVALWRKPLWVPLVLAWLVLVGFDRLYLGVHFYSQVLLGWCFGFAVAGVHGRLHGSPDIWEPGKRRAVKLIAFHIVTALMLLAGILLYEFRDPYWDPEWSLRIFTKCNKSYSRSDAETESLIESAMIAFVPAAFLGSSFRRPLLSQCRALRLWQRGVLVLTSFVPLLIQGAASEH